MEILPLDFFLRQNATIHQETVGKRLPDISSLAIMPRKGRGKNLDSSTKKQRYLKQYRASQKASQGTDSKNLGGFQSCEVSAISIHFWQAKFHNLDL